MPQNSPSVDLACATISGKFLSLEHADPRVHECLAISAGVKLHLVREYLAWCATHRCSIFGSSPRHEQSTVRADSSAGCGAIAWPIRRKGYLFAFTQILDHRIRARRNGFSRSVLWTYQDNAKCPFICHPSESSYTIAKG